MHLNNSRPLSQLSPAGMSCGKLRHLLSVVPGRSDVWDVFPQGGPCGMWVSSESIGDVSLENLGFDPRPLARVWCVCKWCSAIFLHGQCQSDARGSGKEEKRTTFGLMTEPPTSVVKEVKLDGEGKAMSLWQMWSSINQGRNDMHISERIFVKVDTVSPFKSIPALDKMETCSLCGSLS